MNTNELTTKERLAAVTAPLLAWYRTNARDLPWRHTRDPYPILVSEIMLQQTRVAAVLGYYTRFLAAFPTPESLAGAEEDRLMSLWQGLGYYSRARNLRRAAQAVAAQGGFPTTYEGLLALPGVGEYTAGAIASAAFGVRVPAVDGNVLRVIARLTDCHDDILSVSVRRRFREELLSVMPECREDIRIYNQAYMELGATVCAPNAPPRCAECPAADLCLARNRGTAEELPVRAAKKTRRVEAHTVFVLARSGQIALQKRPETGLLSGMWEFPNLPGTLDETQAAAAVARWGLVPLSWEQRLTAKHLFTHVEWHMTGYVLRAGGEGPFLWADREQLAQRAIPSAYARFRAAAESLLREEEPQ